MNTVAQEISTLQDHQEGEHKVNKDSLDRYIDGLIHANAIYVDGQFTLNVSDLSHEDKTIFLSRLVSAEDYEFYMQSPFMLRVAIRDNEWFMQTLVNSHLPQVWTDINDEIDAWKQREFFGTNTFAEQVEQLPDSRSGICQVWRMS